MAAFATLAVCYRYPAPGRLDELCVLAQQVESPAVREPLDRFLEQIGELQLWEWEELHTRTLDLAPVFVPYVGHSIWGERYERGEFMAALKRAQQARGVDPDGELPDHLVPVLRYLDSNSSPIPELVEVIERAIERMLRDLRKAEPENPYCGLLDATREAAKTLEAVVGGAR